MGAGYLRRRHRDRHACAAVWWRRSLARSLDHAHAVRGGGDGGGGGGRLHRASFVSCASHAPFVSRAYAASSAARHQRFPSELSLARDRYARAAAAVALARSLYRARGVAVAVAVAVAVGYDARQSCHAHHAVMRYSHTRRVIAARRARHRRFPSPRTIGSARCGGWRRSLAR